MFLIKVIKALRGCIMSNMGLELVATHHSAKGCLNMTMKIKEETMVLGPNTNIQALTFQTDLLIRMQMHKKDPL